MRYAGVTIFLLFFGISLLDAIAGGHWIRAGFWLAMGIAFWLLDRARRMRSAEPGEPPGRPR